MPCLRVWVVSCALALLADSITAQSFPARPIRIICPCAAGSTLDYLSRTVSPRLAEQLAVPVIVDNRAGANGVTGSEVLFNAAPDGHTLLITDSKHAFNAALGPALAYDSVEDFTAVVQLGYIPLLLIVHPSVQARSVADLLAIAKARPAELRVATPSGHGVAAVAGQLLQFTSKANLPTATYASNALALVDVLGGKANVMFDAIGPSFPLARSGRVRMLAVTSSTRAPLAPDVPTMAEAGLPGFDVRKWFMVIAPNRTARNVVTRLNSDLNKMLASPAFKSDVAAEGFENAGGTPEQASAYIRSEIARWRKVLKTMGMQSQSVTGGRRA